MSNIAREPLDLLNQSNAHPNPMFDFLTGFSPRKLKDLFRWTEYLYYNSPNIFAALQKLADYIITDVTFDAEGSAGRTKFDHIMEHSIRIKAVLKACARDRMIYGNSFSSMYFPFKRVLSCDGCRAVWDIRHIPDYKYEWKNLTFKFQCPSCGKSAATHLNDVRDLKIKAPDRINVIRWDPKLIDLDQNPVTGEVDYYYSLPQYLREKIMKGSRHTINSLPKGILESVRDKKVFKFENSQIHHMRVDAPAGVDSFWGFPLLTSSLKQFYYAQVLRKANEAIALDHITPFRVLHPAQTSGSADPVQKLDFARWRGEVDKNLKMWRRDPLHIMFAPVALGVTQMGGQGRTLLTLGEVKEAEDEIIAGMGIPREFLYGGLSYTGSSVTLRMLENQLIAHTADLKALLQWITDQTAKYMGWETVETDITNFKFIDDVQQKSMLMQANAQYDFLSKRTIAETFQVDLDDEMSQKKQEILDDMRLQSEIDKEVRNFETSLAEEASQEAYAGSGMGYDQQAVIANADGLVEQLMAMDENMRQSQMAALQSEDLVMYAVVRERMQVMQNEMTQQAKTQAAEEGAPQVQ